jgi:hypothetical protein
MKHDKPAPIATLAASARRAALARQAFYDELELSVAHVERKAARALPIVCGLFACGALLGTLAIIRLTRRRPATLALIKVDIRPFPQRHPVLVAVASTLVRFALQRLSRPRAEQLPAAGERPFQRAKGSSYATL